MVRGVTLQLTPEEMGYIKHALEDNITYAKSMLNDWGNNLPEDVLDAGNQLILAGTILTKLKGLTNDSNKKKTK